MPATPSAKPANIEIPFHVLDPRSFFSLGQHAWATWVLGAMELALEIGDFARNRMQEDCAVLAQLLISRNPGAAVDCQRKALEKAATEYLNESQKLSRMAAALSRLPTAGQEPAAAADDRHAA